MSNRIIDEQVVKMEFDNSKFEQNAQASLRTIDKLKSALKFENANKGFSEIENAASKINLNKLENNIQTIANRFSTLGIIGDQVMRNLTSTVMGAVGKIGRLLSSPIHQMIEGGKARAMNIANAQFSLKGQGIDWKKESEEFVVSLEHMTSEEQAALEKSGKFVDSLYKDIDYAVSGTAYGLDSAAKAAAQLSASGVKIGDDMRIALRGISGVAAMTNTSYDDIARIFMHVAGKNKVQLEELNMISERGLGVSAKLAEAIGVSEAEISDMVSKGKIDFATFAKAMDDAFGEHAKAANDTFNGALSNMKAALSRIGADVAGPAYDAFIKPLNQIRSVIDNIRVALQPLFKDTEVVIKGLSDSFSVLLKKTGLVTDKKLGLDQMPRLVKTIENLENAFLNVAYAIARVVKPFRLAFMDVFKPSADIFVTLSGALRQFTEKLIINAKTQKTLYVIFSAIFKVIKSFGKILTSAIKIIAKVTDSLSPLIEYILMFVSAVIEAIAIGVEWIAQSDLLNAALQALSVAIPFVIQFIAQLVTGIAMLIVIIVGAVAAFINWINQFGLLNAAIKLFQDSLNFLIEVGRKVVDTFKSFFEMLFGSGNSTEKMTSQTEEMSGVLSDRLAPALDDAGKKAENTKTIFERVADFIGKCIKVVGDAINKFYEGSRPLAAAWGDFFKGFKIDTILRTVEAFIDYISQIDLSFEGIVKAISDGYNKMLQYMGISKGGIDWDRLFKIAKAAGMLKVVTDLLGLAKKTSTVATQFSKEFTKLSESLAEYLNAEAFAKRVSAFKKICEGIVLLAAALFIVGAIREDRLIPATIAIGILVTVGAILMEAIKYLDKRILPATDGGLGVIDKIILNLKKIAAALALSFTIGGIGASVLMISAAMWILAGAFITWNNILSDPAVDPTRVLTLFGNLALCISIFLVIAGTISYVAPATGWTLLGLAITIGAFIGALYALLAAVIIFNQFPWDEYKASMDQIAQSIATLVIGSAVLGLTASSSLAGVGLILIGIAVGLLAITHACDVFKSINPWAIVGSIVAIGVFIVELVLALTYIMEVANTAPNFGFMKMIGLGFAIMSVAYAVAECANVIKKLSALGIKESVVSFLEVAGLLYLVGSALSKIGLAKPTAAPILAMAILIGAISMELSWVATYDWEDILKSISMLGLCLLACSKVLKYASVTNHSYMRIFAMASVILAAGIALSLLATQPLGKVAIAIVELGLAIFAISKILSAVSVAQGRPRTILAFSVAIAAIAASLWALAWMDPARVIGAAFGLSIAIGALAGSLIAISKFGQHNIGIGDNKKVLLTMIGLMVAIAGILYLLARFTDTSRLLEASAGLSLVLLGVVSLYEVIAMTKVSPSSFNMSKMNMFKYIGAILLECTILVGLLSLFHFNSFGDMLTTISALLLLIVAFIGLYETVALTTVAPGVSNKMKKGMFVAIGAIIAECAIIVGLLSNFANPDRILEKILALDTLIGGVILLYAAIAAIPQVGGANGTEQKLILLGGVAVMIGVLMGIEMLLGLIPQENTKNAEKAAILLAEMCGGLVVLILSIAGLSALAGALAGTIAAGLPTIGIIAGAILAVVGALVYTFAGLTFFLGTINDFVEEILGYRIEDKISSGVDVIESVSDGIGRMLGSFFGGIAGGFLEHSSGGFEKYAQNIVSALQNILPIFDTLAQYDTEKVDNIKGGVTAIDDLFKAFVTLQNNEIDPEILSSKISAIAQCVKDYDSEIAGHEFNVDGIKASVEAASALTEMITAVKSYVELEQSLLGFSDIETMGANLVSFGECLAEYNDTVSDVEWNTQATKDAIETARDLVAINNQINPLRKGFTEYSDIETFGDQLESFADSFVYVIDAFNSSSIGTSDKVELAVTYAERLNALAQTLGGSKGLIGIIVGEKDSLEEFAKDIGSLGDYLSTFSTTVSGLKFEKIDETLTTIDKFCTEFKTISESGYDNEIVRNMIGRLPDLGRNLKDYAESVAELDTSAITASAKAAKEIVALFNAIGTGTYTTDAIDNFVTGLETLGTTSFDKFITAFNGPDVPGKIKNAIDTMFSYLHTMDNSVNLDRMYQIGQSYAEKLVAGMTSEGSLTKIRSGMTSIVDEIKKCFQSDEVTADESNNLLSKTGSDMLKLMADGFDDTTAREYMVNKIKAAIKYAIPQTMLDVALTAAIEATGVYIISLIAKGIQKPENVTTIASAVQSIISQAVQGITVDVGVGVNVAAGAVLGETLAPQVEAGAAKYMSATNKATTTITTSQNAAASTVSKNDAKQSAAARKAYQIQRAEERKAMRAETKKSTQTIKEDGAAFATAIEKATKGDIVGAASDGFKGVSNAVSNGFNGVTQGFTDGANFSTKGIEEKMDAWRDEFGTKSEETTEKVNEEMEDMQNSVKDGFAGLGNAAAAGGKGAAGGAKAGGDAFVASYSEFWQNVYAVHTMGMQGFEKQLETFEQWQENTLKKTQEIVDNYKNAMGEAKKKAAEGLFSEVPEPKEDVTKEKLKKNLEDQVNQIKEFNNIILQLRTRLMGTNLFDAITEMGVDSIDELRALNSMTDTELSEYASLYDQKYLASFQTIQQKAQSELQNLYGGMQINIDQFAATFDGSLKSVEGYFAAQAETIKAAAVPVGSYFTQGVAQGMNDPEAQDEIQTGVSNALVEGETSAVEQALTAIDAHSPAQDERVQSIGSYFTQGIAQGMHNEEALQSLTDAAELVMQKIIEAFNMADENQEGGSTFMTIGQNMTNALTNALTSVETVGVQFHTAGSNVMTKFLEGFKERALLAPIEINTTMNSIANAIKSELNLLKFKTAGTELFKGLMKGFEMGWTGGGEGQGGGQAATSYGKKTIDKVMKGIFKILKEYKGGGDSKGKSNTFYKIGQEFIKGLIKGLESKQGELYAAVERIVKEAIARAKAAAAVASPSKKTTEIGMYMGMGLVNGLSSMANAVGVAAEELSEEALQGFRDISNVLGGLEDFDATPVIAPIMDLSNVQNGVSEMGALLSKNSSYEMAASINSGLEAQRVAKLNEMTNLRRAMDSVYSSNTARSNEMAQLQAAVASLNSSINNQTAPDYSQLQTAINGLNASMSNVQTGNTFTMNPTFNITSNDPEAVAEEVNNALQQMIDRRSAVWA